MSDFFTMSDCDITNRGECCISLTRANALLRERGVPMYGIYNKPVPGEFELHSREYEWSTHAALLINITPLEADSAEKIVADLVAVQAKGNPQMMWEIVERARNLINKTNQQQKETK